MPLHPYNRRVLAEDLVRVRRADDARRYAASQRQARIDPNPHQIDAVIFALRRLDEGGCILADEVGLGKTIEAGLVIAQRRAEGVQRVLLVVPKALIGQWQGELDQLFRMQVIEEEADFSQPGTYIVSRNFAGGERGSAALSEAPPFDLVVIDEAHEMFAGIHRRYRNDGTYDAGSPHAITAQRVRETLRTAPVLLLTATPIQNSLAELWGLVQYVEPTGTLLGDLSTFREVFCAGDDRTLQPGQEHELQRRLARVCQRTLRRQAQAFLDRPFMGRVCRLYEYPMSPDERALYDDVSEYLLEPRLHAFAGRQRRLLLIGFHRRMASSIAALTASLEGVARRLAGLVAGDDLGAGDLLDDLEEDLGGYDGVDGVVDAPADRSGAGQELARVRGYIARAKALPADGKARAFLEAMALVRRRGVEGSGSGKAVVFTESVTTQEYIRTLLTTQAGFDDSEVTLFRGDNEHPRAHEALRRWERDAVATPSRSVAMRLALVHEFRTRSAVLVCTEAGAKGLNLQFCETVVNYDLPWNPQRIEQRIGRCHRYSQTRDVTVVNFLAADNEAHRLTFEILARKLELFGRVLDASDRVLHEPTAEASELMVSAVSTEFESDLRRIYDRSRTMDEVTAELAALRDRVADRRAAYEQEARRTEALIEARFDGEVRRVFRGLKEALPRELAALDADLAALVAADLNLEPIEQGGRQVFVVDGRRLAVGDARGLEGVEALNRTHPIVQQALDRARAWAGAPIRLTLPAALAHFAGVGTLAVARVAYGGFEPVERLVAAAVVNGAPLPPEVAAQLLRLPATDGVDRPVDPQLEDALDEALFVDQIDAERAEQEHFEASLAQLERFVDDRILVERRALDACAQSLRQATLRRDAAVGAEARSRHDAALARLGAEQEALSAHIATLESRNDKEYRRWRDQWQAQRYQAPTVHRLLTVPVELVGPSS